MRRRRKDLAVIMSPEEYRQLMKMREALEDAQDIADAEVVLDEVRRLGSKSLEQVAKEHEWDEEVWPLA